MLKEYIKRFFVVIGLFIISQIGTFSYGIAKQWSLQMGEKQMSLVGTSIVMIIFIVTIGLSIYIGKRMGLVNFKLDFFTKKNTWIILGGFIGARIIAIAGTLLLNSQGTESTANDQAINMMFTGENPILVIMVIGISAPIMEEIVFRGGIMGYFLKDFPIIGIILSTLLFGLIHGPTDIPSFLIYTVIGFILSFAYHKTKRLEVSMSIHFLNNILPAIALAFGLVN